MLIRLMLSFRFFFSCYYPSVIRSIFPNEKQLHKSTIWLILSLLCAAIRQREASPQHGTVGRPCEVSRE